MNLPISNFFNFEYDHIFFFQILTGKRAQQFFLPIKLHTSYRRIFLQKKEAPVGADASSERKDKNAMSKEL
mgnify:CR=1 FL=1